MKLRLASPAGRVAGAVALGLGLAALAGCGPRNKIGDRLLGIDSLSNGRSRVTSQQPAPHP